jgi:dimethylaniline monooxygenase (N-oxide forming)
MTSRQKSLAIVGGGSSGLISLKYAIEFLPDWKIVCYEKSNNIQGCWGNPYPGFVSTSTKYTTQFSCYAIYSANVHQDGGESRSEFFREDEYGIYLEKFAREFELQDHIQLLHEVTSVKRGEEDQGWDICVTDHNGTASRTTTKHFDAVVLCTGLTAQAKPIKCELPRLTPEDLGSETRLGQIQNKNIIVIGGGESAVDFANRLAKPELHNRVTLSLKSGIRVSPRYHPIRGVPSDFLRNRLMLSIHPDLRNWIGQRFVELRIKYQDVFERLFPGRSRKTPETNDIHNADKARSIAKKWSYQLTKAAKDDLFNMFHNKSDDFLQAVGEERIQIVGAPLDQTGKRFQEFDSEKFIDIEPDFVLPAIGYRSRLSELSGGKFSIRDFYLGCMHSTFPDLFVVGFARPIIGNIPSISEMQARWVAGLLADKFARPSDLPSRNQADIKLHQKRFSKLNLDAIYPVEMFPYCDQLARLMSHGADQSTTQKPRQWRDQFTPASTLQYDFFKANPDELERSPVYMPVSLILFLYALKPLDWLYRLFHR